jgi:hypothetical protein
MYIYKVKFYITDHKKENKISLQTPEKTYQKIFYYANDAKIVSFYINKLYNLDNIKIFVNKKTDSFTRLSINVEKYNNEFRENNYEEVYNIFGKGQIHVSNSLIHLEKKICTLYNLETYYSKNEPLIIFGLNSKNY